MTAPTFFHTFVGNSKRYPGKVQKCGEGTKAIEEEKFHGSSPRSYSWSGHHLALSFDFDDPPGLQLDARCLERVQAHVS
jgi:hypothetical protein